MEKLFSLIRKEINNAEISITPTYSKGPNKLQTGYCGVTEVIDENICSN